MIFTIEKKIKNALGRAGVIHTPHGDILTPAFAVVGTKATIKAVTPAQVKDLGAQVVLANTYHLYLEPGEKTVKEGGGLGKFMGWEGPTMTDSGGFQVFSLGSDFDKKVGKIAGVLPPPISKRRIEVGLNSFLLPPSRQSLLGKEGLEGREKLAKIDEDGVTFKSPKDGGTHRFTPERSIEIQHALGADIIFAFDECASPDAPHEYQKEAIGRTHRWAERSLRRHRELQISNHSDVLKNNRIKNTTPPFPFGIVQGGRFPDLRKESARTIGKMDFDGFGIGGSFEKKDIDTVLGLVNSILPKEKPRHLLGIGEPADLFGAVENGCDLFDCVAPTRRARNGSLYTSRGLIAIENTKYKNDFSPIDPVRSREGTQRAPLEARPLTGRASASNGVESDCNCYTCKNFTRAYLSHLFRAEEILASTLATIHNLYFIVNLMKKMRQAILEDRFEKYRDDFLDNYKVSNSLTVGTQ